MKKWHRSNNLIEKIKIYLEGNKMICFVDQLHGT